METGKLTVPVQSTLPPAALALLATGLPGYVYAHGGRRPAYVMRYRTSRRSGSRLRSAYLGPLGDAAAGRLREALICTRSPQPLDNCPSAPFERDVRKAQADCRAAMRVCRDSARACGFRFSGRTLYRSGAVGTRIDHQLDISFVTSDVLDRLHDFTASLEVVRERTDQLAAAVSKLLAVLAAHVYGRGAGRKPPIRMANYVRTLNGCSRTVAMVRTVQCRIAAHIDAHKIRQAA